MFNNNNNYDHNDHEGIDDANNTGAYHDNVSCSDDDRNSRAIINILQKDKSYKYLFNNPSNILLRKLIPLGFSI